MSLEIREMILRTTLIGSNDDGSMKKQPDNTSASETNTEYVIAECMERLMEWLREENER